MERASPDVKAPTAMMWAWVSGGDQVPRQQAGAGPRAGHTLRGQRGADGAGPVHRHDPSGPGVLPLGRARHRRGRRQLQRSPRPVLRRTRRHPGRRRRDRARPATAAAARPRPRLFHPRVLRGQPIPATQERHARGRDPRRHRRALRRQLDAPRPAYSADGSRGRRRLDRGAADGVPQAVGAEVEEGPRPQAACAHARDRPGRAGRCDDAGARATTRRSRLPRSAIQPASLFHQLSRLGDPDPVGRAGALRHRLQTDRQPLPRHQERLQPDARDAARPRAG